SRLLRRCGRRLIPGFLLGFQCSSVILWNVFETRILALLKSPDIGDGRPAILNSDLIAVGHHGVVPVRNGVKDLAVSHLTILVLMVVRDAQQRVFGSNPIPLAGRAVADSAIDCENFSPSLQELGG